MATKILFSEWFQKQQERTCDVGAAAKLWYKQPGLDRRGRVNAARLARLSGISEHTASKVMAEYKAATV